MRGTLTTWSESVVRLAGAWKDPPAAEKIRTTMGNDADRKIIVSTRKNRPINGDGQSR
jgi:hypothetical protein